MPDAGLPSPSERLTIALRARRDPRNVILPGAPKSRGRRTSLFRTWERAITLDDYRSLNEAERAVLLVEQWAPPAPARMANSTGRTSRTEAVAMAHAGHERRKVGCEVCDVEANDDEGVPIRRSSRLKGPRVRKPNRRPGKKTPCHKPECRQSAFSHDRLCYYHAKIADGLLEPTRWASTNTTPAPVKRIAA